MPVRVSVKYKVTAPVLIQSEPGRETEKTFKTSRLRGALVPRREFDINEPARVVASPQPKPAAGLTGI